jgi:hypothetical protein
MAKTKMYSMEKILTVREVLRKLPVKEKEKSRAEVVEFLKTDLRKAVKQGHSLKEIQAMLAEQGVSVPLSRMEAVLGQPGNAPARKNTGVLKESKSVDAGKHLTGQGKTHDADRESISSVLEKRE